ncbi:MAG: hypothetical protein KDD36_06960 [Flavobacteriales bacterium]|nr:hypothetical protein [Flavobacteriales bacterium]
MSLTEFVRQLPYGRNLNRSDLSLVLREKKGTCSSKHALLKRLADLNNVPDVQLILGIYKMNEANTPGIGEELSRHSLDFIPEAHCYLKVDGERIDLTTKGSDYRNIAKDVMIETEIQPSQVAAFKVSHHQDFLKQWIRESGCPLDFDEIWQVRENCIRNLAGR